jgi:hypothetical protein
MVSNRLDAQKFPAATGNPNLREWQFTPHLAVCGALAAALYTGTVILGGILTPGYSHLSQPVSELVAAGATNRPLLSMLFLIYNLLVCAFGVGLCLAALRTPIGILTGKHKVAGLLGGVALGIVGLAGILLELFFPQDSGGANAPTTFTGAMHIAIAGVAAMGTILAIALVGLWFRSYRVMGGYSTYSFLTAAVIFVSGAMGAIFAGGANQFFGLVERTTIGAFIAWLFVMGLKMRSFALDHSIKGEGNNAN